MATRYVHRRVAEDDISQVAATYLLGKPECGQKGFFQEQLERIAAEMGYPDLSRSAEKHAARSGNERVLVSAHEALRHARQARQQRNVDRMVEAMASLSSKLASLGVHIDPDARTGRKTGAAAAARTHGSEEVRMARKRDRAAYFHQCVSTGMKSEAAADVTAKRFGVKPRTVYRDVKAVRENS